MKTLSLLAFFAIILFSCSDDKKSGEAGEVNDTDTTSIDTIQIDTTIISDDSLEAAGYDVNEEEKILAELNKVAPQWDFCDCVVKNDSVQKAIETASDEQIDAIFIRMEEIDKHCKHLLTQPNTTPEERSKYKRKVNKCLRNARKK